LKTYKKKFIKSHRSQAWWCVPLNPSTQEAEAGGSQVQDQLGYRVRPCLKRSFFKKTKQQQQQNVTENKTEIEMEN
jgi:hypothetical protein